VKSSRHFRIVTPGFPERIISPAILLAKTSRVLGEIDISVLSGSFLQTSIKPYCFMEQKWKNEKHTLEKSKTHQIS